MSRAYGLTKDKLELIELKVTVPDPGENEVTIRHTAVGINFFDYGYTIRRYPLENLGEFPIILGFEGCGIVEAVGSGVKDYKEGDKVAYATGAYGAFAERRTMSVDWLLKVPELKGLTDVLVAGTMTKGLMARALAFRVFNTLLLSNTAILVTAAAGGVGHLLTQYLAQNKDITVIGAVGNAGKKDFAKQNGCKEVVDYEHEDLLEFVRNCTSENGVSLVYDSVGGKIYKTALECLGYFGTFISYGEASGGIPEFDIEWLDNRCLSLTRSSLDLYISNRMEYILSAETLWDNISNQLIKPMVTPISLNELPRAIATYTTRNNIGSMVINFS